MEQRLTTLLQQKWFSKMLGYAYEISYKKGVENVVSDALSRKEEEIQEGSINALSGVIPSWTQDIIASYDNDEEVKDILQKLCVDSTTVPNFVIHNVMLRYKRLICVGKSGYTRFKVYQALHNNQLGGHSGGLWTIIRVMQLFYWSNMQAQIKLWVKECDVCQRHKSEVVPYSGLLQPLQIPNQPWVDISMDFIESLPISTGKIVIWVIVDKFTKYAHFLGLHYPYTASSLASLFVDQIYKLYVFPKTIVSDRVKTLLSYF